MTYKEAFEMLVARLQFSLLEYSEAKDRVTELPDLWENADCFCSDVADILEDVETWEVAE